MQNTLPRSTKVLITQASLYLNKAGGEALRISTTRYIQPFIHKPLCRTHLHPFKVLRSLSSKLDMPMIVSLVCHACEACKQKVACHGNNSSPKPHTAIGSMWGNRVKWGNFKKMHTFFIFYEN